LDKFIEENESLKRKRWIVEKECKDLKQKVDD
jgi:uncharacterized protein YlxP (DUF503 family)